MQQDHQALQWAADLGKDWSLIESLLPQDWQSKARELGTFRRCGAIANARALLQVLLIHLGQGCSLRETAVQARLAGIAHVSDVALLKRLRSCSGWFEWLGQQLLLPGGRARQRAKLLVLHIVQTQCIAVAEQNIRARPVQHGGLSQAGHAAAAQKFIPRQKVAVAHHEEQRALLRGLTQQGRAFGLKAARFIQRIVTHPDFKQIAQNVQRIHLAGVRLQKALKRQIKRRGVG